MLRIYLPRLTLKTTCGYNGPKTEFICPVQIASYGWTAEDVEYTWTDKPIMVAKVNWKLSLKSKC